MTKKELILKRIWASETGITAKELSQKLKISEGSVYAVISSLRKLGHSIVMNGSNYCISKESTPASVPVPVQRELEFTKLYPTSGHNDAISDISKLSPKEQDDYLDMLQKSIFYKMSAQAVIQSNKIVSAIRAKI